MILNHSKITKIANLNPYIVPNIRNYANTKCRHSRSLLFYCDLISSTTCLSGITFDSYSSLKFLIFQYTGLLSFIAG